MKWVVAFYSPPSGLWQMEVSATMERAMRIIEESRENYPLRIVRLMYILEQTGVWDE